MEPLSKLLVSAVENGVFQSLWASSLFHGGTSSDSSSTSRLSGSSQRLASLAHLRKYRLKKPHNGETWNGAITLVRDNLSMFANLRGGRVRSSSFVLKHRRKGGSVAPLPMYVFIPSLVICKRLANRYHRSSVLAMAPMLMVSAVATGKSYDGSSLMSRTSRASSGGGPSSSGHGALPPLFARSSTP